MFDLFGRLYEGEGAEGCKPCVTKCETTQFETECFKRPFKGAYLWMQMRTLGRRAAMRTGGRAGEHADGIPTGGADRRRTGRREGGKAGGCADGRADGRTGGRTTNGRAGGLTSRRTGGKTGGMANMRTAGRTDGWKKGWESSSLRPKSKRTKSKSPVHSIVRRTPAHHKLVEKCIDEWSKANREIELLLAKGNFKSPF